MIILLKQTSHNTFRLLDKMYLQEISQVNYIHPCVGQRDAASQVAIRKLTQLLIIV